MAKLPLSGFELATQWSEAQHARCFWLEKAGGHVTGEAGRGHVTGAAGGGHVTGEAGEWTWSHVPGYGEQRVVLIEQVLQKNRGKEYPVTYPDHYTLKVPVDPNHISMWLWFTLGYRSNSVQAPTVYKRIFPTESGSWGTHCLAQN